MLADHREAPKTIDQVSTDSHLDQLIESMVVVPMNSKRFAANVAKLLC